MLGRFLAYKAMNSVWRSATRRSGLGGASAASPAEMAKLALAIVSYAGIFFGGMASCMAGGAVMLSLGLALVWIIGPAVLIAVLNLPDRWVESKRPLPEGWEGTQGRRVTAQMVGVPVVMLLGIGTCFGGPASAWHHDCFGRQLLAVCRLGVRAGQMVGISQG